MKKVRYLFLGMLLMILGNIQAQVNIAQSPNILWPSSLSFAQKDELIKALNKKLDNYKKTATLLNKKTGRIDRESVDEFKKNFSLDAKIFNDMYEYDQDYLQDLDGYIQLARLYFPTEGVRFGITKADLIAVEETDNRYTVIVRVEKQTEKYYDAEGIVHDKVRFNILDFVYDIRKGDTNSAKITTIRGVNVDPPANYYTYYGLELNYNLSNWNFKNTLSESPVTGKSSGKITNNNGKAWSAGFVWRSNFFAKPKSASKNLFLLAGIRVSNCDWTIDLSDYQLPDRFYKDAILENDEGEKTDSLFRTSKNIQLKESYSSLGVNASLGVSYRVFHTSKSVLMVDLTYVPGFDLSTKSTISGTGDYDLVQKKVYSSDPQPTSSVDYLKKDLYLGKDRPIEYSTKPGHSINHSVGLSAMYYKDLQNDLNSLGVALGLDLVWGLTSKIKDYTISNDKFEYINDAKVDVNWDESKGIPFRQTNLSPYYPLRDDGGVLGYYLRNSMLRQIGIKLIIYYKQGRKP